LVSNEILVNIALVEGYYYIKRCRYT